MTNHEPLALFKAAETDGRLGVFTCHICGFVDEIHTDSDGSHQSQTEKRVLGHLATHGVAAADVAPTGNGLGFFRVTSR